MGLWLVAGLSWDCRRGNGRGRTELVMGFVVVVLGEELWILDDKF